jgi:hypothetical protein
MRDNIGIALALWALFSLPMGSTHARTWSVDIVPFHDLSPVDGIQTSRDPIKLRPGDPYERNPFEFLDDPPASSPTPVPSTSNVFAPTTPGAGTTAGTDTTRSPSATFTSPTATTNVDQPTTTNTDSNPHSYVYPESSVPPLYPPRGYFNYDFTETALFGPGYPVMSHSDGTFRVQYANNMWQSPSRGGGNWMAPYLDYEWDEFGSTGWGPWVDTLTDRQLRINNQCGGIGGGYAQQSPIDVRLSGVACVEHHQIRTLVSDVNNECVRGWVQQLTET